MASADIYYPDRLFLSQKKLAEFASGVPTPFYLYHEAGIRTTACGIRSAFRWNGAHRAYFPISANDCPEILRIFLEAGFGALARSERELALALRCGFSDILFHTAAMTPRAARLAGAAGCAVIFDAPDQIEVMAENLPERCLLRYHPDRGVRKPYAAANSPRNKSGMSREQIFEAARMLSGFGVREIGLHCHLSGNACYDAYYPAAASVLFQLAEDLQRETGIRVCSIDPGGGIGLRSGETNRTTQFTSLVSPLRDEYRQWFAGTWKPAIYTEFGRHAIARHGLMITSVAEVRERSRLYAILDVSTAQIPGVLMSSIRQLSVVGNLARSGRRVYSVHGCTPNARERICDRAVLPPIRPGALIAIRDAGAYCESVRSSGCLLPECGSYLYTREGEFVPTA